MYVSNFTFNLFTEDTSVCGSSFCKVIYEMAWNLVLCYIYVGHFYKTMTFSIQKVYSKHVQVQVIFYSSVNRYQLLQTGLQTITPL